MNKLDEGYVIDNSVGVTYAIAKSKETLDGEVLTKLKIEKNHVFMSDSNSRARAAKLVRKGDKLVYLNGLKPTIIEEYFHKVTGSETVVFDG